MKRMKIGSLMGTLFVPGTNWYEGLRVHIKRIAESANRK